MSAHPASPGHRPLRACPPPAVAVVERVAHTRGAHDLFPGSRLEIVDDAGHFPHAEQPERFARVLADVLASTEPAHTDVASLRRPLAGPHLVRE